VVEERRQPLGLVGVIAPWNYPFELTIGDSIPALLAGNGVLLKPDHQTSFSALYGARLLEEAGLPPGLLQVVTGNGPDLGTPIVDAVDFLMFTGSTQTGRLLAAQAGARLIPCAMELGGKNPMVVLDDADMDWWLPAPCRPASPAPASCASRWSASTSSGRRTTSSSAGSASGRASWRSDRRRLGDRVGSLLSARQLATVQRHVTTRSRRARPSSRAARPAPTSGRTSSSRPCSPT
jgi:succinate-semialdehyde dehydrogenase/glutarate-semialdehyde dehydrogenase